MTQSIHLLEPSLLTPDKYFKVYSKDPVLLFIKVGGQFYDEKTDEEAPFILGLALMIARKLFLNKFKAQAEAKTDRLVTEAPNALLSKSGNFDLDLKTIQKVELKTKATKHTSGTDNGTILIVLKDGSERKFTIPSFVPRKTVINFFENQHIDVEITAI